MRSQLSSLLTLAVALGAFAAEDGWEKVRALKSGTEIRIAKKPGMQVVVAKLDEVRDDSVVVVVKNEQVAIPKDQIERLDARPQQTSGSRVTKETKTTTDMPDARPSPKGGIVRSAPESGGSTSTNVTIGSKPDFETIYRRSAAAKPAQ